MKEKFAALIEVRKMIAIVVVVLFVSLAAAGRLETQFIQTVIISVISWYFGKSTALDNVKKPE